MHTLDLYMYMYTRIIIAMHYILQTNAVSLTTETVTSHENVLLPRLVKTVGIVSLGTQRTSLQQYLAMILASVSDNNRLCTVYKQIVAIKFYL